MNNKNDDLYDLMNGTMKMLDQITKKAQQQLKSHIDSAKSSNDSFNEVEAQMEQIQGTLARMNQAYLNVATNVSNNDSRIKKVGSAMEQLEENAESIKVLVKTINSVADQTSLIALNAVIQAAKAGEQGKPFKFVAGEIEKLASITGSVNENIDRIATTILTSVQDVSGSIAEIRKTIVNSLQNVEKSKQELVLITAEFQAFASSMMECFNTFQSLKTQPEQLEVCFQELAEATTIMSKWSEGASAK